MNTTEVTLVNCLLKRYNLEWTEVGLRYNHKLNYGYVHFPLTRDFKKVQNFVGITGLYIQDIEWLYLITTNSKLFDLSSFKSLKTGDNTLIQLRRKMLLNSPKNAEKPHLALDNKLDLIDKHFSSKIKSKVTAFNKAMSMKTSLTNKFNGRLVMLWSNLKPGPILANTIEDFKSHIEVTFGMGFLDYLNSSCPNKIKLDFDVFYNKLDYLFELKSDLPF